MTENKATELEGTTLAGDADVAFKDAIEADTISTNTEEIEASAEKKASSTSDELELSLTKLQSLRNIYTQLSNIFSSNSKIADPLSDFVIDDIENLENIAISSDEKADNELFERTFPQISREKLENDEIFSIFKRGRDKNASLVSIYTDYCTLCEAIERSFKAKSLVSKANQLSSVGSLASSETVEATFFTKEQVLKMSREQIAKNYSKIRESQQKW